MIQITVFLATVAIALPYGISPIALKYGQAVAQRFLERPGPLPSEVGDGPFTASLLKGWASDPATRHKAKGYAHIIMPLDVVYLTTLGLFFATASSLMMKNSGWQVWILP